MYFVIDIEFLTVKIYQAYTDYIQIAYFEFTCNERRMIYSIDV